MSDYYAVLGVAHSANADEIKQAYKRLALQWHPDKNPDKKEEANKRFLEISQAYDILSNAGKRHAYDYSLLHPGYGDQDDQSYSYDQEQGPSRGQGHGQGSCHCFPTNGFCFSNQFQPYGFERAEELFREILEMSAMCDNMYGNGFEFFVPTFVPNLAGSHNFYVPFGNGFFQANNNAFPGLGSTFSVRETMYINGKKMTTERTQENGNETMLIYENDVLVSKTVNGVNQRVNQSNYGRRRGGARRRYRKRPQWH